MNGKICAKCQIELRPKTNGVYVLERATFGPYALWVADLWHCPGCGLEVILGFAPKPFAEHYQADFVEKVEAADRPVIEFWLNQKEKGDYHHGRSNSNPN